MKDEALKLALEALEKSIAITMANIDFRNKAITAIKQALAAQPAVQEPVAHSYASTQATMCACCGERKHTPLRIDKMDGYVCLTCIDKKLGSLLGEFGHPPAQPAVPDALTSADIQEHIEYVAGWNDCRAEMLRGKP
jgi:hypothetical protein